jgi:hypothetical protein
MNSALDILRRNPAFWGRGENQEVLPTGLESLDTLLPGGGWPFGRLTEILLAREGVGELRLLVPALARLSREGRWVVWVSPPHWPYGPALAVAGFDLARFLLVGAQSPRENLWAAEQALGSGTCGAVVVWMEEPEDRALRRLQLAAERGKGLGVLFRPLSAADRSSPASLRLSVEGGRAGLAVRVLKGRSAGRSALLAP